jgi:hypothetical protein
MCAECLDGYDESFKKDCLSCGKRYLGEFPTEFNEYGTHLYIDRKSLKVLQREAACTTP